MLETIKKLFAIFMKFPAIGDLLKRSMQTGKIDPIDAIGALSSIPGTKKVADTAFNAANRRDSLKDVATSMFNLGEIEIDIDGEKRVVDTRNMKKNLKEAGGFYSLLGNILDTIPTQSVEDAANFGKAVTDVKNWEDLAKNI